jgi:hypothetical protein
MVTKFLVQARDVSAIDPRQIAAAGGHLVGIGRMEDDGTVTFDVDIPSSDRDANRRLSDVFVQAHHTH